MADKQRAQLGAVQETLFVPLAARARASRKKHAILRDPKAVQLTESIDFDARKYGRGASSLVVVLRTAIFDMWVRSFMATHPDGTVVEIGTGLNTRFERLDNGTIHWIDMDLPDTIELRRKFFTDTERGQMIAASVTDEAWLETVADSPGPYLFVSEGVLVYLTEPQVTRALTHIAERFPGAFLAFDTYAHRTLEQQHRLAARRNIPAKWAWACDDPRDLERLGLRVAESTTITRPPGAVRTRLPVAYRYLLPLIDPVIGRSLRLTLFQADSRADSLRRAAQPTREAAARSMTLPIPGEPDFMVETTDGLARASAMLEVKRYEQAAALLAELVAAEPDDDRAWGLLARAHLGAGRYSDAATAAARAAVLTPWDDWPHRLISKAHLHQGQPGAAMHAAHEACRLAPQEWRPHLCLAQAALAAETDLDVAAEAAATARRIVPDEADVHFVSGMVSLAQGDRKAARAHQERVLALDPAHSGALNELGRISLQRLGVARGARHFLQAARLAPRVSVYGFNLEVVVRRTVGVAVSLATVPSCVLTYLAALLHLPRGPVVAGLTLIAILAATFGVVQYRRMPPELRPLFRRRRIVLAAAAGYGSILAVLVVAAVTPAAALPGALVAMTVLAGVARLVAFGSLLQRSSAGALPGRSTGRAGSG